MKWTLIFLFSLTVTMVFSQDEVASIAGSYRVSGNSPEGGSSIIVMPNNKFVVGYFGGMRRGTWEFKDGNYYFEYQVEPKFVLYGRVNPSIKDSIALRMCVDGVRGYTVRFNGSNDDSFLPIFNEGANCFSYPYIYKQKEPLERLAAYAPDPRTYYEDELRAYPEIYDYIIKEDYNEFILAGLKSEYSEAGSFTAIFKDNSMVIDGGKSIKKGRNYEDLKGEDMTYIENYTQTEILPVSLEYGNEFFPNYEEPSVDELIPFSRIEAILIPSGKVKIGTKSLFVARCEDRN